MTDQSEDPVLFSTETPERCAEYLRLSLALMGEVQAAAHPVNYSLFFHHVAGNSKLLSEQIEKNLSNDKPWDDDLSRTLFLRHLLPCNDLEASGLQQDLSEAVTQVVTTTTDLTSFTSQHAAALREKESELSACTNSHVRGMSRSSATSSSGVARSLKSTPRPSGSKNAPTLSMGWPSGPSW